MSLRTEIARFIDPSTFQRTEAIHREASDVLAALNEHVIARESFSAEMQMASEDRDFLRINQQYDNMFTREFLGQLIKVSRFYFLKNPIIRRGILLQSYYVFGRGVEIRVEEDEKSNEALQEFIKLNRQHLGITGLSDMEQVTQTDGNRFLIAFRDETMGTVKLRTVDTLEITDILTNPEDADEPWYYLRQWTETRFSGSAGKTVTSRKVWYPAMGYEDAKRPPTIMGNQVQWNAVIHHRKVNCSNKSLYGIPEAWAAFAWAKAYRQFMESWLTKEQALARLALEINTPGGQKAMDAQKSRLQTSLSTDAVETNPAPNTGSVFIHGPNSKIQTIKTSGSNTSPDEARRAFLMAIMLFGPETFFGDASVGSLATAKSLDRPTELKFTFAQERWREDIETICEFALGNMKAAPGGIRSEKKTVKILVSFPPILEHDIVEQVNAIIMAATLDGKALAGVADIRTVSAMVLHVIGIKEVDKVLDSMYPPDSYDPQAWAAKTPDEQAAAAAEIAAKAQAAIPANPKEASDLAGLATSVTRVVEAVKSMRNGN